MRAQIQHRDPPSVIAQNNSKTILAGIRELAPEITARAAEIEAARRIPPDLIDRLKSIGLFRIFVPKSHGGLELALPDGAAIITALARLDGSVGWTAVVAVATGVFATWAQRETYDRVYRDGPNATLCGSSQPAGTAERVAEGWRINGRWPLASGCMHAEWMAGFCIVTDNGKPAIGAHGGPIIRGVVLPAGDWEVEDSWYAAGLKGTGSHHIALKGALVPEANLFDIEGGVPCVPGALYPAVRHLLPLFIAAFSAGVAQGALDDLVALAHAGRQQFMAATPMQQSEVFQFELGRTYADLRAAQAFLHGQVASHWNHALAGTLNDEALLVEGTQASAWIASTCVRVVDACFALAGTSAIYDTSLLQRRLRDLHVAAQHYQVQRRQYVAGGKLVLANRAT